MKDPAKFKRSFRFAYEGIKYALATQQNMQFHFLAAFVVLILALVGGLSKLEVLFLLLAVTLVIVTELINTAIEKAVDLAMPEQHPLAKIAKDVAAASVLIASLFAVTAGMIVFYEPLERLLVYSQQGSSFAAGLIWIILALVALTVIVVQTRFQERNHRIQPSLLAAVSFAACTLIILNTVKVIVALLGIVLTVVLLVVLYEKKGRPLLSLLSGGLIGLIITLLAAALMNWI
jgi:diacylglycerol kinase